MVPERSTSRYLVTSRSRRSQWCPTEGGPSQRSASQGPHLARHQLGACRAQRIPALAAVTRRREHTQPAGCQALGSPAVPCQYGVPHTSGQALSQCVNPCQPPGASAPAGRPHWLQEDAPAMASNPSQGPVPSVRISWQSFAPLQQRTCGEAPQHCLRKKLAPSVACMRLVAFIPEPHHPRPAVRAPIIATSTAAAAVVDSPRVMLRAAALGHLQCTLASAPQAPVPSPLITACPRMLAPYALHPACCAALACANR